MKKLFTFLSRANNNSIGISFNHRRVSFIYSMLTLVAIMLMVPQLAKGAIVTTTYDFGKLARYAATQNGATGKQAITMGSSYSGITAAQYGTETSFTSNGDTYTLDLSRFAFRNNNDNRGWILYSDGGNDSGFMFWYATPEFAITNLKKGDNVEVVFKAQGNRTSQMTYGENTYESTNGGFTTFSFDVTANGDAILSTPSSGQTILIIQITIKHDTDAASFSYDPAVEIYDLYNVTGTYGTSNADFNLNGSTAKYITTLQNGMSLNNRIAIDGSNWVFNDHGLKAQGGWHNLSVCNLREGDRVVIQYTGQATFSSAGQNGGYNGCPAFKDVDNDGDFNGQDVNIDKE